MIHCFNIYAENSIYCNDYIHVVQIDLDRVVYQAIVIISFVVPSGSMTRESITL